jgi:hypothetical protein
MSIPQSQLSRRIGSPRTSVPDYGQREDDPRTDQGVANDAITSEHYAQRDKQKPERQEAILGRHPTAFTSTSSLNHPHEQYRNDSESCQARN